MLIIKQGNFLWFGLCNFHNAIPINSSSLNSALLTADSLRGGRAEGNRISETDFFYTLTIQNDQISYVKHVLAPVYVFFTLFGFWWWGGGGGAPKGSTAHNLLMQFSRLRSSKIELSETDF